MSTSPRKTPIVPDTASTIRVSLMVSWRVGQVTRRNSAMISPTDLRLMARRAASEPSRRWTLGFLAMPLYLTSRCTTCVRHLGQYFFS